jgi:signal transduction histidine kinase
MDAKAMIQVLLVEDSPSDAALLQENLQLNGSHNISIMVAASLHEAAELLNANQIDMVLLDLTLPDSSGLDTVRWARRVCSNLPVVVLTGTDDEKTGIEAVRMGVQDYLVKNRVDGWIVARAIRYSVERKRFEEALRRSHDELELRVEERTLALRAEVAERQRADEAVKAERQRLFEVMETLPVSVILLSEDYHVLYANRFFRNRFGESDGKRCYELLFSRTTPCDNCRTFEVLKTNTSLEWEWLGPDGRNYFLHDFPFIDTNGVKLILQMGIDITEEKRLREGLERQTAQLRELASELTLAEQRERRRVAEVLHDNLQQLLVAARLRVSLLGREKNPAAKELAVEVDDLLAQSIAVSRILTTELNPYVLHGGKLAPAMEWLAKWMSEKHGISVKVKVDPSAPALTEDVGILLFQSVKELIFNAVKHANVKTVQLDLTMNGDRMKIVVSDSGAGFDPSKISIHGGKAGGFGLLSVRERLEFMGGSMGVESMPGEGTRVTLESPPLKSEKA